MSARGWIAWIVLLALLPGVAQAHKASDAYLQLEVRGAVVEQRFDIALRDLDRELVLDANDDGRLDWREVRSRWAEMDRLSLQGLQVEADGRACRAGDAGLQQLDEHSDGRYAVLTRRWTCAGPVHALALRYGLFAQSDPTHRGIARVQLDGREETAVLVPGAAPHGFGASARADANTVGGFSGFVREGVHHILIGSDHILFLLALLLPAVMVRRRDEPSSLGATISPRGSVIALQRSLLMAPLPAWPSGGRWVPAASLRPVLVDVLRVVTAFTVAHSITLALAAFDVLNPPSRGVESLIAASVVFAALNNLVPMVREGRWKLTFVFGLVHGFGFASALKDAGLAQAGLVAPLLGFNLGVELGQLAIVAAFVALVWKLRDTRFYAQAMLCGGSVLIALVAAAWFVERAADVRLGLPF